VSAAKWEWCAFHLGPESTDRRRCGWAWEVWRISGRRGEWTVYHVPSGKRVTSFTGTRDRRGTFEARRLAKRFCEEIDGLADWSGPDMPASATLGLRLHRIALRIIGGRPDLRIVEAAPMTPLEQALAYAARGRPVFPIRMKGCR
jgi:hypothetical protein